MAPPILPAGLVPASMPLDSVSDPSARPRPPLVPLLSTSGGIQSVTGTRHPVDDAAVRALSVRRGSGSAIESIGHRLSEQTHLPTSAVAAEAIVRQHVELAWGALIDAGKIRIDGYDVRLGSSWVGSVIRYTNLVTMQNRELSMSEAQRG